MSRLSKCSYCQKVEKHRDMIEVGVRILCVQCFCKMNQDRLERLEKFAGYINKFLSEKFPEKASKRSLWE
jgi:hypothetical protein